MVFKQSNKAAIVWLKGSSNISQQTLMCTTNSNALDTHPMFAHHLTNQWCSEHFLGYTPKLVPSSQSDLVGCACLQSLHIHHISLSSDRASSEGRAFCADLGSEHKGGVTGVFQEHSNTSTAPSGGLIRSHHHWLHGDVRRDCGGEGEGQGEGKETRSGKRWHVGGACALSRSTHKVH